MQASNLILLWIFFFQGKIKCNDLKNVFLHCKEPFLFSGTNVTIDCHINSTAFHQNCSFHQLFCSCNTTCDSCVGKKQGTENKTNNVIVEISNIKESGTCILETSTSCGILEKHTVVNINISKADSQENMPATAQSESSKMIGSALGVGSGALIIVVFIGVVGTLIYKRRKGYRLTDPEVGAR